MRHLRLLLSLLGVCAIMGCGAGTVQGTQSSTGKFNDLTFRASAPVSVPIETNAIFSITVMNNGSQAYNYEYGGCGEVDAEVSRSGTVLRNVSAPGPCNSSIKHASVPPGQAKTFTLDWDLKDDTNRPLARGFYTVQLRMAPFKITQNSVSVPIGPTPMQVNIR